MVEGGLGFNQGSPTIKTGQVDLVESPRLEVKGRVGQGTKVSQNSLVAIGKLDEVLSSGHYVTNIRENIWVSVMIHQDVIIARKLVTFLETIRTAIIEASPTI